MVTLLGRYNVASCRQSVITCLFNLQNPSSTGSPPRAARHPGPPRPTGPPRASPNKDVLSSCSFFPAPSSSNHHSASSFLLRASPCPRAAGRRGSMGARLAVMDDLGPRRVLMERRFHASQGLVKHGLAAFFTQGPGPGRAQGERDTRWLPCFWLRWLLLDL